MIRHSGTGGVIIAGTEPGCGKTVLTGGLAGSLMARGFRVQAFKPLEFTGHLALRRGQDQAFINQVSQQFIQAEGLYAESPWDVPVPQWNRMLEQCRSLPYPPILEAPGRLPSPWSIRGIEVIDALDMAALLNMPVLLAARYGEDALEQLRLALSFIRQRNISCIGFVLVQTTPVQTAPDCLDAGNLLLSQTFEIPCLGILPYSPSISVPGLQQGNLLRLTEEHIDLLPLQIGMQLTLETA